LSGSPGFTRLAEEAMKCLWSGENQVSLSCSCNRNWLPIANKSQKENRKVGVWEGSTMSFAFAPPEASAATSPIVDAARCWRTARDIGDPVQPAMFKQLEHHGYGVLAPVLDGLLSLFEAGFRRPFQAGDLVDGGLTSDEHHLLDLLESQDAGSSIDHFRPDLLAAMQAALRSCRIMLGSVIWREIEDLALSASRPIFFAAADAGERRHLSLGKAI
jgi:hypothetical protein